MISLTILHTNDLHGRVSQLSKIAALVRKIRQEVNEAGGYCLFVDAGDAEDTTLLESSLTKGSAMAAVLRAAGCEYVALGNAVPIRYGHQAIADLAKHFGRPLLCANMKDEAGKPVEGLAPFSLRSFASLKLALIGLTAPIDVYRVFFNLNVEKPESVLPELLAGARAQGAKTILVLSHLGSPADQSLAKEIGGIDVIIGAHDHKELDPPLVVNHTIIAQAGDFGRFLGRLDLKIDPNTGRILEHAGRLIPVGEDAPLDPETQQAMQAEQQRAQQTMSREIGILNSPIKLCDDEECAAGNLLADALLERLEGAELCLVLPGHWESGLEAGILTQGTLFAANRSTANPARVELTGRQIEQFLHEALKPENAARQLHALRGRAVGLPHVAGARVTYSDDLEQIDIQIRGKTLEKDRKYVVASTDMEFSEFVNYLVIPFKLIEFEVPTITPEVLQDYIARHSPIQAPETGRILLKAK